MAEPASVAPAPSVAPAAAPPAAPVPVRVVPESTALSVNQAEAQLADLFAKSRGADRERGDDGKFKGKEPAAEPAQARQEPAQDDAEAPEATDTPEPVEAAQDDAEDLPGIPGVEAEAAGAADGLEEVDFEHNGKTYKVPKPLVDGALRQAKFTQEMQELADNRRHIAAEKASVSLRESVLQELALPIATLKNTTEQIAAIRGSMPDPEQDPIGYMRLDKQARDLEAGLHKLQEAVTRRGTELAQQEKSAKAELLQASYAAVSRAIPKWTDAGYRKEAAEHAMARGFTQPELDSMTDPRVIGLLNDAMLFRKIQQAKADVRKKVSEAPPAVKPSASTNRAATQQAQSKALRDRVRKTGSTADAQAAIRALLEGARKR